MSGVKLLKLVAEWRWRSTDGVRQGYPLQLDGLSRDDPGQFIHFDDWKDSRLLAADFCFFFAMGFEHSVVNLFVIPLGMALGAKISFYDWWYWNEIPALFGNLVGGFATGFALYTTNKPDQPDRHSATITRHPAQLVPDRRQPLASATRTSMGERQ
jgi:hypothetical protein